MTAMVLRARSGPGRLLALLGAALAVGAFTESAAAQQKAAQYEVSVWEIRATRDNDKISKELRTLAAELKKRYKYTGYTLVKKSAGSAKEGGAFSASLSGGYRAKVTPLAREGQRITLKVQVAKPDDKKAPGVNTTFKIDRGAVQLAAGLGKYGGSDDVMIVGVSAR